jgi:hypothetical protein
MQVIVGDALRWAPPIERQTFKCSACSHVAQRLVLGALPISTSGTTTRPQLGAIRVRAQRPSEPQLAAKLSSPRDVAAAAKVSAWARAVEKLYSRQAALKEREASPSAVRCRAVRTRQGEPPGLLCVESATLQPNRQIARIAISSVARHTRDLAQRWQGVASGGSV